MTIGRDAEVGKNVIIEDCVEIGPGEKVPDGTHRDDGDCDAAAMMRGDATEASTMQLTVVIGVLATVLVL